MKRKRPSQQTVAATATHSDLPDECWEYIFRFIVKDDLNSLSLVSKQFLSITNSLLFSLIVQDAALPFLNRLLERFTKLKSLNLSPLNLNHDLNNLLYNISHFLLKKLTSLKISNLHTLHFPLNGLRTFSQNIKTLTSLTCSHCFLRNNDLSLIAECFPLLEVLDINNLLMFKFCNPLITNTPTNFLNGMYSLLSKCRFIQHLDLNGASFPNDQHVAELSLFLVGLKSIDLSSCYDLTESALFSLVRKCPSLSEIKMERTSIGKESAVSSIFLSDFVIVSPQLKSLCSVRCEHLKDENIILFASIFPNLELVDLSSCHQISEGICQVLRRCCKIRHLNLAGCSRVNIHGINFVVPKLEVLDLSYTKVDDETLFVISKNCLQLRKVYLVDFHISNEIKELFSRRGCLLCMYFLR